MRLVVVGELFAFRVSGAERETVAWKTSQETGWYGRLLENSGKLFDVAAPSKESRQWKSHLAWHTFPPGGREIHPHDSRQNCIGTSAFTFTWTQRARYMGGLSLLPFCPGNASPYSVPSFPHDICPFPPRSSYGRNQERFLPAAYKSTTRHFWLTMSIATHFPSFRRKERNNNNPVRLHEGRLNGWVRMSVPSSPESQSCCARPLGTHWANPHIYWHTEGS